MSGHIGGAVGHLALPVDHGGRAVLAAVGGRVLRFEADEQGGLRETWASGAASGAITALEADDAFVLAAGGWPDPAASVAVWSAEAIENAGPVRRMDANGAVHSIGLGQDRAWLGRASSVLEVDLSKPDRPRIMPRPIEVPVAVGFPRVFSVYDAGDQLWALAGAVAWISGGSADSRPLARLHGGAPDDEMLAPLVDIPESAWAMAVDDTTAWVAVGLRNGGLRAFSLADPNAPTTLSSLPIPVGTVSDTWVAGLDVDGTQVLVGADGLRTYDGSDPRSPAPLAHVPGPQSLDVVADDGVAWMSDTEGVLRRFTLDDPAVPQEVAFERIGLLEPRHVAIVDNVAWVVDRVDAEARLDQLRAVDIARPESPRLLETTMDGLEDVRALVAAGKRLVIVEAGGAIKLVGDLDGSNDGPTVLRRSTVVTGVSKMQGVAAANEHLAVVPTPRGTIWVLDVVDGKDRERFYDPRYMEGIPKALGVFGEHLWMILQPIDFDHDNPRSEIVVVAPSSFPAPPLLRRTVDADLVALHGQGSVVAVASGDGDVTLYDGAAPEELRELGRLQIGERPTGIHGEGDQLWLRTGRDGAERLWRVDVGDPARPVLYGSTDFGDPITDVAVARGLAIAARGPAGLYFHGALGSLPTPTETATPAATAIPTGLPPRLEGRIALPWLEVGR